MVILLLFLIIKYFCVIIMLNNGLGRNLVFFLISRLYFYYWYYEVGFINFSKFNEKNYFWKWNFFLIGLIFFLIIIGLRKNLEVVIGRVKKKINIFLGSEV